jgi:hypothetical protein
MLPITIKTTLHAHFFGEKQKHDEKQSGDHLRGRTKAGHIEPP